MQTTNNIPDYSVVSAVLGEHEALINVDLHQDTSSSSEVIVVGKCNGSHRSLRIANNHVVRTCA